VKKPTVSYEPAFGGIVAVLATALLCFVLSASWGEKGSHTETAFFAIICVRVIAWGINQVSGHRKLMKHPDRFTQQAPLLGSALSCVLVGLLFLPVTLMLYQFAPAHHSYAFVAGGVTVTLLAVGAVVGIRQGVWRNV
jgi:hypothetical protein